MVGLHSVWNFFVVGFILGCGSFVGVGGCNSLQT